MKKRITFILTLFVSVVAIFGVIYGLEVLTFNHSEISIFGFIKDNKGNSLNEETDMQTDNYMAQSLDNLILKSENLNRNSVETSSGSESLTDQERVCYNLIKSRADQITNEVYKSDFYVIEPIIIDNCKLESMQIKKILYAIQNDRPDIFWLANTFSYSHFENKTTLKLNSILSAEDQKDARGKLKNKVESILGKVPKNASDFETELLLHDYVVDNCKYEKITANHKNHKVYTAYGCLVEGSAVCEGYSKAMQILLCNAGIKCRTVTGARGNEPHMWNIVRIGNAWYHLDATWDSAGPLQRYNYFNVSDEIIKKDHVVNLPIDQTTKFNDDKRYNFQLPICGSMQENYFEKTALKISVLDEKTEAQIMNKLYNIAVKKAEFIYLKINPTLDFALTIKQLFTNSPYKFFNCVMKVNEKLNKNYQINSKQVYYAENKNQDVLTIQINYT